MQRYQSNTYFLHEKEFFLDHINGIVAIDMKGDIIYLNRQCMELIGYSDPTGEELSKLIGKHVSEVFPYTQMLDNLDEDITEPQIVFYRSAYGTGISVDIPLMKCGKKVGLMEYDILQDEKLLLELADDYNAFLNEQLKILEKKIIKLEQQKYTINNITGSSSSMKKLRKTISIIARSNSSVFITGETGTGKELVAHAIHNLSDRKFNPLVKINASAFPENLVESELFGYRKGSFTGAAKEGKKGKFEYADHGTLFIDEIQQMPLHIQPKFLRVLQEHEVEPIGSNEPVPVDVRIIAASNQNIDEMVRKNLFRKDLFYRLNVITIRIPPLREHKEDIEELTAQFIDDLNIQLAMNVKGVEPSVIEMLKDHDWPGNIRELRNVIERAMNFADGEIMTKEDFEFFYEPSVGMDPVLDGYDDPIKEVTRKAEKELIEKVLSRFDYNKTKSAEFLRISRPLLYQKMNRLGISKVKSRY